MLGRKELVVALSSDHEHFVGAVSAKVVVDVLLQLEEPGGSEHCAAGGTILILDQILTYLTSYLFRTTLLFTEVDCLFDFFVGVY